MSLYLYSNYESKRQSTNVANLSSSKNSSTRSFLQYRHDKSSSSCKALNMNDQQKRIHRNDHYLFRQSSQESLLFQKGIKKIVPCVSKNEQKSVSHKRKSYHNKQTYNVVNPLPINQSKMIQGGVKRIYLYDQKKQTNPFRDNSSSKKKFIKNVNQQTCNIPGQNTFLVQKLATHRNASTQWHNSTASIKLLKKQNMSNKENLNNKQNKENEKLNFKEAFANVKNKSNFVCKDNGITLGENSKVKNGVDFNQRYYEKYSRTLTIKSKPSSGFYTQRNK